MSVTTQQTTIKAAMAVAKDVAEGRLDPDELGRVAAAECRELFGTVAGPDDALWPLQVDVARQVLALGGVPAAELSEWMAVAHAREPEAASGPGVPTNTASSASEAHSPESGGAEPPPEHDDTPEVQP